jgi:hypothetical protein
MKPLTAAGIALVAFLVGGLVCRGDRSGDAAQRTADSLQVLADSFAEIDYRRGIAIQADSQRLVRIVVENRRLAVQGHASERRADSLAGLVLDTASVVARSVYDATVETYRGLVQTREAERDTARAEAGLWKARAVASDSSVRRWTALATAYRVQLAQALKRSRWGCVGGISGTVGYGYVGDRAGVGTVAGIGVTCGKRL